MNKKYIKLALINVLILIPSIFAIFAIGIPNQSTSWKYSYGGEKYSVSSSSNGTNVVIGGRGEIHLINQVQRELLWKFQSGNDYFDVDISADGYYIAACGINGEVYLFNKLSNVPIWSYTTGLEMMSIAISRDGNYIVTANYGGRGKLFLFNNTSSIPIWIYTSPSSSNEHGFSSVAISDIGSFIFASRTSGNASLFNNVIGTPIWTYDPYPEDDIWMGNPNVAISSEGNYMAMLGDGQAIAFNKTSPIPYWIYNPIRTEMNRERNICITSNGSKIYCVGDGIYIFNTTATSNPLIKYIQFAQISSIGISQDGKYFATNCMGIISIYRGYGKIWEKDLIASYLAVDMSDDGSLVVSGSWEELFFINRDFPEFIEDYNLRLIIGIIILAGSLAFEAIMIRPVSKYLKRSKSEKLKQQQENFEKLMTVSSRIRIGMLKNVLKISNKDLNEKIERWQRDFDVIVEGEYLIFNEENLPEILDLLDEQYEEWTKKHEKV
jgi:WD40 repeat protein